MRYVGHQLGSDCRLLRERERCDTSPVKKVRERGIRVQSEKEKEGIIEGSEEGNSITPVRWSGPKCGGGGGRWRGGPKPKRRGKMSTKPSSDQKNGVKERSALKRT